MADPVGTDVTIHVWYDDEQKTIKMRIGTELTSVRNEPESKRGNPDLFKKLAAVLRDAGKRHPSEVL
ncbi:hypothetical protein [Methylocapsa sp. S129]|uniref:hypothetical protein n=1 Tax=Methylocapsa sp. S129 TaxID=1641869 RepID=UPI00131C86BB|nr:hypothetical protein [Methylocapsa sp. S129]